MEEDGEEKTVKRGMTRKWIRRRGEKGFFNNIVQELRVEDTKAYKEMLRMSHEQFLEILSEIEPMICKHQVRGGHKVISPAERLTLTLRFFATGETFRSLHFQFRIGRSTISYIVREVSKAIYQILGKQHLKTPCTEDRWQEIASKFDSMWQFPNCIGAVDGKHLVMHPPPDSGSHYFNYKHTHSIVLMAVAGPDYECLYADVGTNGRVSDGGVWNKCQFLKAVEQGVLSIPSPKPLPFRSLELPHVLVGDDAFALRPFLMKPFPQRNLSKDRRIYNYRHSRARRVVENLFGIMANRWRVFQTVVQMSPEILTDLTLAVLTLHNMLIKGSHSTRQSYCPRGLADEINPATGEQVMGTWRQDTQTMLPLTVPTTGHNSTTDAKAIREEYKEHFLNEGSIPWQWEKVVSTQV